MDTALQTDAMSLGSTGRAMSPVATRQAVTSVVLAGAVVLGGLALLSTFVLSSASPKAANIITVDNESYYFENVTVKQPGWSNFSFLGVTFGFHAWCGPVTPGGVTVCGNVSPSRGILYPFSLYVGAGNPRPWFSPTQGEGIIFEPYSAGLARLLVEL
jgi:hypothetical protein